MHRFALTKYSVFVYFKVSPILYEFDMNFLFVIDQLATDTILPLNSDSTFLYMILDGKKKMEFVGTYIQKLCQIVIVVKGDIQICYPNKRSLT